MLSAVNMTFFSQFFGAWEKPCFARTLLIMTFFVPSIIVMMVLVTPFATFDPSKALEPWLEWQDKQVW